MTPPPDQPRTCGGCKWFRPITDRSVGLGNCLAPAPKVCRKRFHPWDLTPATHCPCWAAKEETK
jgi:hypothetical protein